MQPPQLEHLACPECAGELKFTESIEPTGVIIKSGLLACRNCKEAFKIIGGVPRFVTAEGYTAGFGLQWRQHRKAQLDSHNGLGLSRDRFFKETGWPEKLKGQIILEVGCGAGRFTEVASSTGATVVSLDSSSAVEANYLTNGAKNNVLIVQGDIYRMPFKAMYFDKIFCIGVLQHTPSVKKAFMELLRFLKPGGELVIDIYKRTLWATWLSTKYYVRPFTCHVNPSALYKLVRFYVDMMWPLVSLVGNIPRVGSHINHRLLVAEHGNQGLKGPLLKEMAYLDTFDMLASKFDKPQTRKKVATWFQEAGLDEINVRYGYNGVVGSARSPMS